uniref:GPI inositol-deacylase n=1 Tax=Clastoptera arizonana TaxID=38151 RepID=A0A1B6CQG4_9HEMI
MVFQNLFPFALGSGFAKASIISLLFYLLSFIVGYTQIRIRSREINNCEMTYMYEYPQFVRISLPPNITTNYRRYGLYAYAEGRFIDKARQMKFDGIPVLFIPGHSGSYKQVRSLASVSLRKSLGSRTPYHFDFFTIDLNEEYSGLFGGVLKDQTRFILHAIQHIFSLYKKNEPDSIVLFGHSMGGVLAKGLFLEPDFMKNRVRLLITLATPHSPVVLLDKMSAYYYQSIRMNWPSEDMDSLTMISVGGGSRDLPVSSALTVAKEADINILSTGVSGAWVNTDHLAILWCKQLVIVLIRAIFDSVDLKSLQISKDKELVKKIFQYHLVDRSAGKQYSTSQHPSKIVFWNSKSHPGDWIEPLNKQMSIEKPFGVNRATYYMLRIVEQNKHQILSISAYNHKGRDWIFACNANSVFDNMRLW